jgi:hypothetical protein
VLTCAPLGQNLFFHLNHPIKWVRIAGMVVAIDNMTTRRIYTLDDSSGATIECVVDIPQPPKDSGSEKRTAAEDTVAPTSQTLIGSDIDVGHVVEVWGGIKLFRSMKQIQVDKMKQLRSTEQELKHWARVVELRDQVLSKPWVLDQKTIRNCRKTAEGRDRDKRKVHKKATSAAMVRQDGQATRGYCHEDKIRERVAPEAGAKVTGLERKRKPRNRAFEIPADGKYDALGL